MAPWNGPKNSKSKKVICVFCLWLGRNIDCNAANVFECPNTDSCLPASYVCDGDNDCEDWSDEQNCRE